MKIQLARDACCAQDDQLGPLELDILIADNSTVGQLVDSIVKSNFLQFSSSHTSMIGEVSNRALVKVFSPDHCKNRPPHFMVESSDPAANHIDGKVLYFRFIFEQVQS